MKILKWNTHSTGGFSSKPCCRGIKMIKPLTNLTNNFRDNLPTAIGRDFAGYVAWRTGLRECRGEALVETWRHRAAMLTRAKVRKIAMRNGYGMLWHCKIPLENKIIYEIAIDKFNQIYRKGFQLGSWTSFVPCWKQSAGGLLKPRLKIRLPYRLVVGHVCYFPSAKWEDHPY